MSRTRWVYTQNGQPLPEPIEVSDDWRNAEHRALTPTEALVYGKLGTATDGTPIDSRRKHREYMKSKGLALHSDFSDEYRAKEKASLERSETKARREAVARAYYTKFKP